MIVVSIYSYHIYENFNNDVKNISIENIITYKSLYFFLVNDGSGGTVA